MTASNKGRAIWPAASASAGGPEDRKGTGNKVNPLQKYKHHAVVGAAVLCRIAAVRHTWELVAVHTWADNSLCT